MPEKVKDKSSKSEIVKRAVRIFIDKNVGRTREIFGNVIQIPVDYKSENEDIWSFDSGPATKLLREVLFRTTPADNLEDTKANARVIFELVTYIKTSGDNFDVSEMCCGWCEMPLKDLKTANAAKFLVI